MGALETWDDAKKWAAHFRANRDRIDGILVLLPVFAPERGIADCIKLSELTKCRCWCRRIPTTRTSSTWRGAGMRSAARFR